MALFVTGVDWTQIGGAGVAGVILAIVLLLFLKPILLRKNGNGNGSAGAQPVRYWDDKFELLAERNEKSFENALKILVIPVMNRTNDILDEMRQDNKKLTEAMVKLGLRDEIRAELYRSKGASASS